MQVFNIFLLLMIGDSLIYIVLFCLYMLLHVIQKLLNTINDTTARLNLNFKYLPAYAKHLSTTQLNEFVKEQIRISREVDLPLLKYLEGMTEKQIFDFALKGAKEFLDKLALNQ